MRICAFSPLKNGSEVNGVIHSLTEDPNVTVGVIEAGEWEPDLPSINIPGAFSFDCDLAYTA